MTKSAGTPTHLVFASLDATKAATKYKMHKRQYIYTKETLIVSKVANLFATKGVGCCDNSKMSAKRVRKERHCSCCSKIRHNSCTCKVKIADANKSNASK